MQQVTSTSFTMSVGGTSAASALQYFAYTDTSNLLFGGGDLVAVLSFADPDSLGAFSGTTAGSAMVDDNYSLTLGVAFSHDGPGATSFNAELNPVPEPGTILLLGAGLLGVGLMRRRKQTR